MDTLDERARIVWQFELICSSSLILYSDSEVYPLHVTSGPNATSTPSLQLLHTLHTEVMITQNDPQDPRLPPLPPFNPLSYPYPTPYPLPSPATLSTSPTASPTSTTSPYFAATSIEFAQCVSLPRSVHPPPTTIGRNPACIASSAATRTLPLVKNPAITTVSTPIAASCVARFVPKKGEGYFLFSRRSFGWGRRAEYSPAEGGWENSEEEWKSLATEGESLSAGRPASERRGGCRAFGRR